MRLGYYVTVEPGVNLYVEDLNPQGKKTILFIHGWPLSHKQFEYQFDVLAYKGYRCIGLDWRGFGNSDKPAFGYHYDRLADDLRVIIDTLQLSEITLVGHSTGGAIAIRYVSRHQAHGVSKLVLVAAAAPVGFTQEKAKEMIAATLTDRPKMMRGVTESFFFQDVSEPFAAWFTQLGLQAAGWSTAAVAQMLATSDLTNDLPRISTPTLITQGVHDQVVPFQHAEILNQGIRDSRLVPFEFSGHGLFWEERDKFNKLLMEFVG
jgi:non-heme chloroperoxidase